MAVAAITLVSVGEEIEIGRHANAQMRREVPELRDRAVSTYVRNVGMRLVGVAPGPRYPYSFSVADFREINAFSLPGGPVWINRGVLQKASNESQVAGVLAHEIAHIAKRHASDRLTQGMVAQWGLGLLGALLGNTGGAATAQAAAGVLAGGMVLKFSRDEEREADAVGLVLLTRAGWDGRGMVELFEMLRREAGREPGSVEAFLSSHPSPQDRIADLSVEVARHRGGRRISSEFRNVRARLERLPPARAMHNR
jgi:predicted Zn-dependent protease